MEASGGARAGATPGGLVALPVGAAVMAQLVLDDAVAGGLATAALFAGFLAFEAPARVRVRWQLMMAPLIGFTAAAGVLSSQSTVTAVLAMALIAALAGLCSAVSARLLVAGMMCVLSLLVAQGLYLDADQAGDALALGVAGGLLQALWAVAAWAFADRAPGRWALGAAARQATAAMRSSLTVRSTALRHALRSGSALALGVAIYRVLDIGMHGYWIPLTILFVLRPGRDETADRLAMRAVGTVGGLILATALAALLGEQPVTTAIVLTGAAACLYALLAIEYALFTLAITTYVVLLTDTLGAEAVDAADERALATAIGIAVAAAAFVVWGEPRERGARSLPVRGHVGVG